MSVNICRMLTTTIVVNYCNWRLVIEQRVSLQLFDWHSDDSLPSLLVEQHVFFAKIKIRFYILFPDQAMTQDSQTEWTV
jgi:hypothetical protein